MNCRVVLRRQIPDDLRGIITHLESSSTAVADRFLESAFAAFDDLAAAPGKGSPKSFPRSGLTGIRSWAVPGFPNHLIFYEARADAIVIWAVVHGARDVRAILKSRKP